MMIKPQSLGTVFSDKPFHVVVATVLESVACHEEHVINTQEDTGLLRMVDDHVLGQHQGSSVSDVHFRTYFFPGVL